MRIWLKLVLLVALAAAAWLGWALLLPTAPSGGQTLLLRPGWSTRHIAAELQSAGVIRSASAFLLLHYLERPRSLKAGEYQFTRAANAVEIHDRLVRGDILKHVVVIPEGFTLYDIAGVMEQAGLASRADFLKAAREQVPLVNDLDPQARTLEGYLFPDTYQFTRTQSLGDMIAVMVHRFRQEARTIGLLPEGHHAEIVAPGQAPENIHFLVTMASIVEKETAAPEERPLVASVYYNRLKNRVALDADPTIIYAKLLAGSYDGSLHHEDLQMDSPYNTYRYPGLPPGPIANPGREALVAALHPANSEYLYFVSDNNGHHRFARTLEEHSRNVVAYRRARAQQ